MIRSSAQSQHGFTLLELLIVFSIMVILSAVGIASFVSYSRSQSVDTAMREFKTLLFSARSRAQSQLRDSSCFSAGFTGSGYVLQGYRVIICCPSGSTSCVGNNTCTDPKANYELDAVYSYPDGSGISYQMCESKKFSDPNVAFVASKTTATTITFASVTGAVSSNATSGLVQVGIAGYGFTKLATVSATGVVQ